MSRMSGAVRLPGLIKSNSVRTAGEDVPRPPPVRSSIVSQSTGRPPNRVNAAALLWLNSRPRWLLGVILIAVTLGGLLIPGVVGSLLLLVLAVFLAWLAAMSWPRVDAAGRLLRVLAIALVVGAAVMHLQHH
jgi:uncharacterized membrane protein